MAILDALPGLKVWLKTHNEDLPEYSDLQEELTGRFADKTVLTYVEAVSGNSYTINLELSSSFKFDCPSISFGTKVDRKHINGALCFKDSFGGSWSRVIEGATGSLPDKNLGLSRFSFAEIKTVDDYDNMRLQKDIKAISGVGEIIVMVHRRGHPILDPKYAGLTIEKDVVGEVTEKALKGKTLSHETCFLPPVVTTAYNVYECPYVDGKDNPLAVFKFRYRSREALQQQLIIPRTPSPDPFKSLSQHEIERLARERLAELSASTRQATIKSESKPKRERHNNDDYVSHMDTRHFKKTKMTDGREIIDLRD